MTIETIDNSNFSAKVLEEKGLVLIDFWADWCAPCKPFLPILDEVAIEMANKVKIFKINIDNTPEIATKYSIRSIPTLKLFKDGDLLDTCVESLSKANLIEWLNKFM